MGLVTFSEEQTNLTVAPGDELRDVGRKVRLASDSRSATYVLFFSCNFMELKLFGLLSFGFPYQQLVWARNGIGELFLVMLCNQKEACLRCLLR